MSTWREALQSCPISDASKKAYISHIEKLLEQSGKPIQYVLSHPEEMMSILDSSDASSSTKRSRVTSVCGLLKHWQDARQEKRDVWTSLQKDLNAQFMENALDGEPTEREITNWVPWDKVIQKEQMLQMTEYASDNHLILAMYTHIEPMRADFGNVKLYLGVQPPDCTTTREGNFLFLSNERHKSYICLNKYKTSNRYGRFHRKLPNSLIDIIRANVRAHPREYLFITCEGNPYTSKNSFGKYVNRVLNYLFGKRMTISLLRHSFISAIDFNASRAKDLIQVSKNMQHSLGMQQYYRRHVPELSVQLQGDDGQHPNLSKTTIDLQTRSTATDREDMRKRKTKRDGRGSSGGQNRQIYI